MRSLAFAAGLVTVALATVAVSAQSGLQEPGGTPASTVPRPLQNVGFEQQLNKQVPLDLPFRDEDGRTVKLGDYFGQRPVVLAFVYYECPMLCTQILNGLGRTLNAMDESVGKEFDVVTVSFDPRETPVLAAAKKKAYLDDYRREGAGSGWHFLTGEQSSIEALTKAAGFKYQWDEQTQQFAHASGIVVLTPDGRLARYFFGIEYAPRDVKFALIESSAGRIGTLADQLMLYCYHYDPRSGSYSLVAMNAVRIGGIVTVVTLVGFMMVTIRREKRVGL